MVLSYLAPSLRGLLIFEFQIVSGSDKNILQREDILFQTLFCYAIQFIIIRFLPLRDILKSTGGADFVHDEQKTIKRGGPVKRIFDREYVPLRADKQR